MVGYLWPTRNSYNIFETTQLPVKKFITSTLPYSNSGAAGGHIGHSFEFVLADVISDYWRLKLGHENVCFNLGLDEHGQKIAQKAAELGYASVQEYCDVAALGWKEFCRKLGITYDIFYRTTSAEHKRDVLRFIEEKLSPFIYERDYNGLYCVGCESYKTEKEINGNKCIIHGQELQPLQERVKCFDIKRLAPLIEDRLVDKTLSAELKNILASDFDFPITRRNVEWAIPYNDGTTLYCWLEALSHYTFAAGYYSNRAKFDEQWQNSLQLCGKDNLKFQSYIFQAILLAAGLPQTKEILVHGTILDEKGNKMSKSLGNVVDPIVQLEKYGLGPLRYYLTLGLSTYGDSAYSEKLLVDLWNNEVVGGFGNLVARTLHLVDIQNVDVVHVPWPLPFFQDVQAKTQAIESAFERYDFHAVRELLNQWVGQLNRRINDERPFDNTVPNRQQIIGEIYFCLTRLVKFYGLVLKNTQALEDALKTKKKVILFQKLEFKEPELA